MKNCEQSINLKKIKRDEQKKSSIWILKKKKCVYLPGWTWYTIYGMILESSILFYCYFLLLQMLHDGEAWGGERVGGIDWLAFGEILCWMDKVRTLENLFFDDFQLLYLHNDNISIFYRNFVNRRICHIWLIICRILNLIFELFSIYYWCVL